MKRVYVSMIICCALTLIGGFSSEVMAIDAYFDSEISTDLEYTPNTGTLVVRMLDEEVPPILPDVVYKRTIYVLIIFDASKTMGEPDINGIPKVQIVDPGSGFLAGHREDYLYQRNKELNAVQNKFFLRLDVQEYARLPEGRMIYRFLSLLARQFLHPRLVYRSF